MVFDRNASSKLVCSVFELSFNSTLGHAEMVAIDGMLAEMSKRSRDPNHGDVPALGNKETLLLSGCTLYVTCEPCIMCASALSLLGIDRVVFG
jgi:tRNA-specific adenosine deaminase 2